MDFVQILVLSIIQGITEFLPIHTFDSIIELCPIKHLLPIFTFFPNKTFLPNLTPLYLFWSGLMTLIPLFWYIKGFELIGIGPASMIFFLTPTAQFFLGVIYYDEPLVLHKLISFIFIWIAVIIYLNELRKE